MKYIVTGGGTGGHIYPALAIAQGLRERFGAEVIYIGSKKGLESEIVPGEGLSFRSIDLTGFKRRITVDNIITLWKAVKGYKEAKKIISEISPSAVIGTGGYVSGPVILAAYRLGIPTVIHEQNAFPGITNRILARFADFAALTFEDAKRFFPAGTRLRITGLPVRKEIFIRDRQGSREVLGLPGQDMVVLSFGGSQGAKTINTAMLWVFKKYAGKEGISFLHATGSDNYKSFMEEYKAMDIPPAKNIVISDYFRDMPKVYSAADLVVSRAGAGTIAEITAQGLPAIFIPYPFASENHQEHNAMAISGAGGGCLIKNNNLTGEVLLSEIERLVSSPGLLKEMGRISGSLSKPAALDNIIDGISDISKEFFR
ncbi:MAG: undecaprenyldiphospho-muramoylpentapeptide beta-N-acetylglucosaminyltransferase [Peptococcaceae bacterium]|nr:undecaprenyldiphospho-muramoylpentapeptide beta-N-acetylglucosaminyltransferase [Peptococcaceae bacterium]